MSLRCMRCLRRDVVRPDGGVASHHESGELVMAYPVSEQCPGARYPAVKSLSETVPWLELMVR